MNSDVYTYTPDDLNQYFAITTDTTVNPIHDLDGNLEVSGQWTYQWNTENQLVEAKIPGDKKLRFVYDGLGRRTSKEVREWDADSNAYLPISITVFTYDGWNMIAEVEYNSTFITQNSTFYTWGLDLSGTMQGAGGVGGLLAVTQQNGSTYLPSYDFNGNIMGYFDTSTESSVAEFEYGPFGEPIRATGAKAGEFRFRFSTKYEDAETGLLYYGYRYYQAETGRWLNRDPIEEAGGLNLYGFVGNDPVKYWDYLGLEPSCCDELRAALEYAKLAQAGYTGVPPAGWESIDAFQEFEIPESFLLDLDSGFSAFIFRNKSTQEIVVSFTGTDQVKDFTRANIPQNFSLSSAQYHSAAQLANVMGRSSPGVVFVGHSLGGGLATAAVANTSKSGGAYTFNSAGLNPKTVDKYGGIFNRAKSDTEHWYYSSDPLTSRQTHWFSGKFVLGAVGTWNVIYDREGKKNPLHNHGIDTLIKGLEHEIKRVGCL